MNKVRYKLIGGLFGEFYRVGTDGSVWTRRKAGCKPGRKGVWRRMKIQTYYTGHQTVNLFDGTKPSNQRVHNLVLEAFIGPRPKGMEARHFPDRNPSNNNLINLQWADRKTNQRDRKFHGTTNKGIGASTLTEEQVKTIRSLHDAGSSIPELAKLFLVSYQIVWNIVRRRTWKYI